MLESATLVSLIMNYEHITKNHTDRTFVNGKHYLRTTPGRYAGLAPSVFSNFHQYTAQKISMGKLRQP